MNPLTIDLPPETYKRLEEHARRVGQAPEALSRELLETALHARETTESKTTRDVLQAAGRSRPLSTALHEKIIPGVTLEEVCTILTQASGPPLSDIIRDHRGAKA